MLASLKPAGLCNGGVKCRSMIQPNAIAPLLSRKQRMICRSSDTEQKSGAPRSASDSSSAATVSPPTPPPPPPLQDTEVSKSDGLKSHPIGNFFGTEELMTELSDSSTGYRGEVLLLAQVTTLFLIIAPPIQLQGLVNLMGILLLSAGAVYILYSLICLGRNMSPMPAPRKRHKLITSGMYGIVRHPMYGGVLFTALGWAAVTMSETRLALSLILWFVLEMKIKYEEDALSARYAEYADYKMQSLSWVLLEQNYVVKTQQLGTGEKVFINVCVSEKIDKASKRSGKSADGKTGSFFDVPLSLGNMKKGTDKTSAECSVFDFVVHPETIKMGEETPAIRNLVVETASCASLLCFKKRGRSSDRLTLASCASLLCFKKRGRSSDWLTLVDFKIYRQKSNSCPPQPHVLAFRAQGSEGEAVDGRIKPQGGKGAAPMDPPANLLPPGAAGAAGKAAAAAAAAAAGQGTANQGSGKGSGFSFAKKNTVSADEETDPTKAGFKHPDGALTPQWELVHRGELDLADSWGDVGRNLTLNTTYPKELVVRIKLPNVSSASGVDLDVSRSKLMASVPRKYRLEVTLPFAVKEDQGRAKFDKSKQTLEVTLPVAVPPPSAAAEALPMRQRAGPEAQEEEEAGKNIVELPSPPTQAQEQAGSTAANGETGAAKKEDGAGKKIVELTSPLAQAQAESTAANVDTGAVKEEDGGEGGSNDETRAVEMEEEGVSSQSGQDPDPDQDLSGVASPSTSASPHAGEGPAQPAGPATESEIKKMWHELHRRKAEADKAALGEQEVEGKGEGDEGGDDGDADSDSEDAPEARSKAGVETAPPAPAPPAFLLRPRLNKALVEELD
eukprot:gene8064-1301_t